MWGLRSLRPTLVSPLATGRRRPGFIKIMEPSIESFETMDDATKAETYKASVEKVKSLSEEVEEMRRQLTELKTAVPPSPQTSTLRQPATADIEEQLQATQELIANMLSPVLCRLDELETRMCGVSSSAPSNVDSDTSSSSKVVKPKKEEKRNFGQNRSYRESSTGTGASHFGCGCLSSTAWKGRHGLVLPDRVLVQNLQGCQRRGHPLDRFEVATERLHVDETSPEDSERHNMGYA